MDAKLSNLSELLYNIQHTQEKMQLQITELLQEYFCYLDPEEGRLCGGYKKAMLNCNIAEDYSNYIADTLEEASEVIEELIRVSADRQKVSA